MTDLVNPPDRSGGWLSNSSITEQSLELVRLFVSLPNSEARRLVLARLTDYAAFQEIQHVNDAHCVQ